MKQYVIDQLRDSDYDSILDFLEKNTEKAMLEGVYRIDIPPELYSPVQAEHSGCQPYYFAIHLSMKQISFELLIRTREVFRCNCIAYATELQRNHILHFADSMFQQLGINA